MTRIGQRRARRRISRRSACLVAIGIGVTASLSLGLAVAAGLIGTGAAARTTTRSLSIHAEPASLTVRPGASARYVVRVARRQLGAKGLGGRTALSLASEIPAGAGVTFAPRTTVASRRAPKRMSSLTVSTSTATPAGTYILRVRAQRPDFSGSTAVRLVVAEGRSLTAPPVATPPAPIVTAPDAFTIDGALPTPLRPGSGEPLNLTLSNREDVDLSITSLIVRLSAVTAPLADATHPCGAEDFAIVQFSGSPGFTLPASSSATLSELGFSAAEWPEVAMLNPPLNQDGCKEASLTLGFAGSAAEGTP